MVNVDGYAFYTRVITIYESEIILYSRNLTFWDSNPKNVISIEKRVVGVIRDGKSGESFI